MKLNGDVYRLAAEKIDDNRQYFSCNAVTNAAKDLGAKTFPQDHHRTAYAKRFATKDNDAVTILDFEPYADTPARLMAWRNHRVIALLMAAAMADTGDL